MIDNSLSVVMPVHNQEDLIIPVCRGIIDNISDNVKEIIIVLDGCTDNTEARLNSIMGDFPIKPIIAYAPDVFEVKATNIGFRLVTCKYSFFLQDDMVITEKDFGKRLLIPFQRMSNLVYVTARDAVDVMPEGDGNWLKFINIAGKDAPGGIARNIFSIRDGLNRGPLLFDTEKMESINFMDEIYAPQNLDCVDVGLRSYIKNGWLCGAYAFEYISKPEWGTTRKTPEIAELWNASNTKNHKIMLQRYADYFTKPKHDTDIIMEG